MALTRNMTSTVKKHACFVYSLSICIFGIFLSGCESKKTNSPSQSGSRKASKSPYLILVSQSIGESERKEFYSMLTSFCLESLKPGDELFVYGGIESTLIASFQYDASKLTNKNKKIKKWNPQWAKVASFLKPSNARTSIDLPKFFENVMQGHPGCQPRFLIIGRPIYDSSAHYDMSKGWLNDGFFNVNKSQSVFSLEGKSQLLAGGNVYFCYLSDDEFDATNDKDAHKSNISDFWCKYVGGMGGQMMAFLPDFSETYPLWRDGLGAALKYNPINLEDSTMKLIIPNKPRVQTVFDKGPLELSGDFLFASGSYQLKPDATTSLEDIAKNMMLDPLIRFRIEGHTDSHGAEGYNIRLSQRRAESVKNWLVSFGGIDASRLETVGSGEARLKVPKGTPDQESPNRRVIIQALLTK